MYHIAGKIYGFDPLQKSLTVSVDKTLIKEVVGGRYFVPFVLDVSEAGLVEVFKQDQRYILPIELSKNPKLNISSGDIGKSVSIIYEKNTASRARDKFILKQFIITE